MTFTRKRQEAEMRERAKDQDELVKQYGKAKIAGAKKRLCSKCHPSCQGKLLPLNQDGSDCIYFKQWEGDKV